MRWLNKNNQSEEPIKRGRGRPRKHPLTDEAPERIITTGRTRRLARLSKYRYQLIVAFIILVLAGTVLYFYKQNQDTKKKLNETTSQKSSDETTNLINNVGKHVVLPEGEQPTIATVTDVSKLAGQPFFTNAQNGDKVLVYNKAGRAILYRPSINKIIEIAPVNAETQQ